MSRQRFREINLSLLGFGASVAATQGLWSLVFMPTSMRFNTNRPEVFYEAIAALRFAPAHIAESKADARPPRRALPSSFRLSSLRVRQT